LDFGSLSVLFDQFRSGGNGFWGFEVRDPFYSPFVQLFFFACEKLFSAVHLAIMEAAAVHWVQMLSQFLQDLLTTFMKEQAESETPTTNANGDDPFPSQNTTICTIILDPPDPTPVLLSLVALVCLYITLGFFFLENAGELRFFVL
jgi:hypothetical protein